MCDSNEPDEALGKALLAIARNAIEDRLGMEAAPRLAPVDPGVARRLLEVGAVFVTLTRSGELRGCIGSVIARRPLGEDCADNAVASALRDSRFEPVNRREWPAVRVEISLLGPLTELRFDSEEEAVSRLIPSVDGVVLETEDHRGIFLPQVWEKLPDPHEFLRALKRKAGCPGNAWGPNVRLNRFRVMKWKESS